MALSIWEGCLEIHLSMSPLQLVKIYIYIYIIVCARVVVGTSSQNPI